MKWFETIALVALLVLLGLRWFARSPQPADVGVRFGQELALSDDPERTSLLFGRSDLSQGNAPMDTLRVVTDFQCPFCRQLHHVLDSLASTRRFAVQLVHLPLIQIHPRAFEAAVAFECAAAQGRQRPMHDMLFDSTAQVQDSRWNDLAMLSGVPDISAFTNCLESDDTAEFVRRDRRNVIEYRVTSTPTVVLNGRRLLGRMSTEALGAVLDGRRP